MPVEERRFREDDENSFGDEGKQADICKDIMMKTGKGKYTIHIATL